MKKLDKLKIAKSYYPNADVELNHYNNFQLLVAVMLSAQTTDKMVNRATKNLFLQYKTAYEFKNLTFDELYEHLKIIGFAKTKTNNLLKLSKIVDEEYQGEVVNSKEELIKLPGVGSKTANVVLATIYGQNYMAVDTHILRISKRLALVKQSAKVEQVEKEIEKILKKENMNQYHHSLIFFGRYHCTARKPNCHECKLKEECYHYKKESKKKKK